MSEFTLSNGMKLHYEEIGQGRPVVMLHGWTTDHTVFVEPAKMLADSAHFIMPDFRGHGGSKAVNGEPVDIWTLTCDLDELIGELGLTDVTLVAWSMGVDVALFYADAFGSSRLRNIVLCDMTPKKVNDEKWNLGLYQGAYTEADSIADREKDIGTLFSEYVVHADPRLARVPKLLFKAGIKKQMKQFDGTVALSLFNAMNEADFRGLVASVDVPLMYFYAEPGSLYSPALAEWYREQLDEDVPYRAVAFPNSTHRFITEYPERFAEELAKVLAQPVRDPMEPFEKRFTPVDGGAKG